MCEYQRINPNNEKDLPLCVANNKTCTFCVLGNAKTYQEAKEKALKENELHQKV